MYNHNSYCSVSRESNGLLLFYQTSSFQARGINATGLYPTWDTSSASNSSKEPEANLSCHNARPKAIRKTIQREEQELVLNWARVP